MSAATESMDGRFGYRTFDVVDDVGVEWTVTRLLALLVDPAVGLRWTADVEMAPSPAADRAGRLLTTEVDGKSLINALALDPQLIEGDLVGRDESGDVRLIVRAVDGAHWDVFSADERVLAELERAVAGLEGEGLS